MAEAVLFSLAGKVANTVASPAFKFAYENARSIWGARDDLQVITTSIEAIQSILIDAEKQQEGSASVKVLIKRLSNVLYEAEDLFDEVATNDLLKKQMEGVWKHYLKEVKVFFSKQNQVYSNYSIAEEVKAIRKELAQINVDLGMCNLLNRSDNSIHDARRGEEGYFLNENEVIGRGDEKKAILEFLDKSYEDKNVSVIAIVGIGGMGKSSLAKLVYNDENIPIYFNDKRRWWASISDIVDRESATAKIYDAILGKESSKGVNLDDLQEGIRDVVAGTPDKFLLVLDDLWDNGNQILGQLMSLLRSSCSNANGSKIIITTRSLAVARAMDADEKYELGGLSDEASWELFKSFAFPIERANEGNWNIIGKNIMKKCANVPLALKMLGSLLKTKDTEDEWKTFEAKELSQIQIPDGFISTMSVLKLSYDYLQSDLKHCFAYCSLFPKASVLNKKNLMNLWIAQGYVRAEPNETLEAVGHAYFMELLRKCFFHEVKFDNNGDIESCKMHDLIHDLAKEVAGTGITVLAEGFIASEVGIRHASVGRKIDESWSIPPTLFRARRMRSFLFMSRNDRGSFVLDKEVTKLRFLRALNLEGLNIKDLPSSIGRLKLVRYLNLSKNTGLTILPNSITKLVNLITLDLNGCLRLESLPTTFRKLISLRDLDISGCESLLHMPSRFGELTCLQHLSDFKVSTGGGDDGNDNDVGALVGLNLRGQLRISYERYGGWSEDEMMLVRGQIPEAIDTLSIHDYPNASIPVWWNEDSTTLERFKLKSLKLKRCTKVKRLPPLRCLPNLRGLMMDELTELEYIEDDEEVVDSHAKFFPSLAFLQLTDLPKLKGWSRRQDDLEHSIEQSSFPRLSHLEIHNCPHLKSRSMPPSSTLQELSLIEVGQEMVQQLVSTNASSSSLQMIKITACSDMKIFPGEGLTSLRKLDLRGWQSLENVELAPNGVKELTILRCPQMTLWGNGEEITGVNWASLANLAVLSLDEIPGPGELPDVLQQRVDQGNLQIRRQIN